MEFEDRTVVMTCVVCGQQFLGAAKVGVGDYGPAWPAEATLPMPCPFCGTTPVTAIIAARKGVEAK